MIDDWLLIVDIVHTENTEGNGGPQADCGVERKLSGINRELKEMGPQADEVRIQVSINDDWLMINDFVHTENTDGYGGPQADFVEWNANYRELIVN